MNWPPTQPTFYFAGVTTAKSSSRRIFPRWMEILGRPEVVLEGVDFAIHDDPAHYRAFVEMLRGHPLALGALITTHKIDLLAAARDLFDALDPYAQALGEVSGIGKSGNSIFGFATDPVAGGMSLDAVIGSGYFGRTAADVLCLGAGGSAAALVLHLIDKTDPADRPHRFIAVNRSQSRLDSLRELVANRGGNLNLHTVCNADPSYNDQLMAALPGGSVVVNATGMGKDSPGSPITDAGRFPMDGVAWELNYRGELDFLHQAKRQQASRRLHVEDGWRYFLLGWSQVIGRAMTIDIPIATFGKLAAAAEALR